MAGFNLADNYRAAGLTPGPDILRTRQEPFEKLRQAIDPKMAIDLVRLYFGLAVPLGTDWFRDAFLAADPSFSLFDNAREASVLAAGLLDAAANDGKIYAALATITTAACGHRQPPVRLDLIDLMRFAILERAVSTRQNPPINTNQIKLPAATKLSADLTALNQAPEIAKASALLKQVSEESAETTQTLTRQVFAVVQPLAAQVLTLREEVEMLWWYIGGCCRAFDKPFADFELGLAAVLAGIDMAEMSRSSAGPAAAAAILQRILSVGRNSNSDKVTVRQAVDALPQDQIDSLKLPRILDALPDICPVLTAYAKAKEIGASPAWHEAYAKATGVRAEDVFAPLELAVQAFRERLLLQALC